MLSCKLSTEGPAKDQVRVGEGGGGAGRGGSEPEPISQKDERGAVIAQRERKETLKWKSDVSGRFRERETGDG